METSGNYLILSGLQSLLNLVVQGTVLSYPGNCLVQSPRIELKYFYFGESTWLSADEQYLGELKTPRDARINRMVTSQPWGKPVTPNGSDTA